MSLSYRTTDIDLAAALLATGIDLMDVQTDDGVVVTFVFPDHYGPGFEYTTDVAARRYAMKDLKVDAWTMGQRLRDLRVTIRRAQDTYRKAARESAGIK